MNEREKLLFIYEYEKNLLNDLTNKILECNSEEVHDCLLNIFDNQDELYRKMYKFLKKNKYLEGEKASKSKNGALCEKLDELYMGINC